MLRKTYHEYDNDSDYFKYLNFLPRVVYSFHRNLVIVDVRMLGFDRCLLIIAILSLFVTI